MADSDGKDMADQFAMMQQMQQMTQMMQQNSDPSHQRSSSWDEDVTDVMQRRLNEQMAGMGVGMNGLNNMGTPDEIDVNSGAEDEAMEELQDIHAEKELILKAFETIDVDQNEDIEMEEFVEGLKKLNVKLSKIDMQKVFNLMDFDKSNYIDRNEFSMFLAQRYESKQLSRMQMAILDAIRGTQGPKHNRKPSGMELRDQQRLMKKQMTVIMTKEVQKVSEEQKILDAIEEEKKERGDEFGVLKNAKEWNSNEVADWLKTLEMEEYQVNFVKEKVTGSQLLYDFNEQQLQFSLGVKKVHVSKLLRGIQQLRDKVRTEFDEDTFDTGTYIPDPFDSAQYRFEDYELKISEMTKEMQELKKEYESRIQTLLNDIREKDAIIKECENQGFVRNSNNGDLSEASTDDEMPALEPAQDDLETMDHLTQGINKTPYASDMDNPTILETHDENNETNTDNNVEATNIANVDDDQKGHDIANASMIIKRDDLAQHLQINNDDLKQHEPTKPPSSLKAKHARKPTLLKSGRRRPPTGTPAYWIWINEKKQQNSTFGERHRALEWNHHEIAYWLKTIKCGNYCKQFVEEKVNGEALLNDVDSKVLSQELGVKMLHAGKIKREIDKLKATVGVGFGISGFDNFKYVPGPDEANRNEELEQKLKDMETKYNEDMENERQEYETKITELNTKNTNLTNEVETLEQKVVELEKRKFTEDMEFDQDLGDMDETKMDENKLRFKTKKVRKLMNEIKELSTNNDNYGNATNAIKWTYKEVCFWLDGIDMPLYIKSFMEQKIDGEILIKDLNADILHDELSVKRFHCGKILREIQKLKLQTSDGLTFSTFDDIKYEAQFSAVDTIEELKQNNERITQELEDLKGKPQCGDDELIVKKDEFEGLKNENSRLAKQIDNLEQEREANMPEMERKEHQENLERIVSELQAKKDQNDQFAIDTNAENWSCDEVCFWLKTIGLQEYIDNFKNANIRGTVIIKDLNADMLSSDLGVKRLHIKQILREAEKLRSAVNGLVISEFDEIIYEPRKRAVELVDEYDERIKELNELIEDKNKTIQDLNQTISDKDTQYNDLNALKEACEDDIERLNAEISKLKNDQKQEMEENAKNLITELETKITELNTEIETIKENHGNEIQELIDEKENEINNIKKELNDLQEQYDITSDKLNGFEEKERENNQANEEYKQSFEYQLKKKAEDDPTFGQPKLALKWQIEEVCYWLYQIRQPEYVDSFRELLVDGGMLLSDLSPDQLRTELGIKKHHLGKIKREIEKLKGLAQANLMISEFNDIIYKPKIENINEVVNDLRQQLNHQKDINEQLSLEVNNLTAAMKLKNESQLAQQTPGNNNSSNDNNNGNNELLLSENKIDNNINNIDNNQIKTFEREIERLRQEKLVLVQNTSKELNRLRRMLNVVSTAYEQLSGTPLGLAAQNATVDQFFKMIGLGPKKKPKNNRYNHRRRFDY